VVFSIGAREEVVVAINRTGLMTIVFRMGDHFSMDRVKTGEDSII
jgi:Cu/Ag efflux protein CusF